MSKDTEAFYGTQDWKTVRTAYKKKVGGLCELCWAKGIATAGVYVHHKIPLTAETMMDPNIALSFDTLQLLCREHHDQVHDKKQRRYKVDDNGHVTIIGE